LARLANVKYLPVIFAFFSDFLLQSSPGPLLRVLRKHHLRISPENLEILPDRTTLSLLGIQMRVCTFPYENDLFLVLKV